MVARLRPDALQRIAEADHLMFTRAERMRTEKAG
jgi:hypothetical protein